jgi:hypothetical protein
MIRRWDARALCCLWLIRSNLLGHKMAYIWLVFVTPPTIASMEACLQTTRSLAGSHRRSFAPFSRLASLGLAHKQPNMQRIARRCAYCLSKLHLTIHLHISPRVHVFPWLMFKNKLMMTTGDNSAKRKSINWGLLLSFLRGKRAHPSPISWMRSCRSLSNVGR